MKALKTTLIWIAVVFGIIGLGIISCTIQLARGVNSLVNEPSTEIATAVLNTEKAMRVTAEGITITTPLIKNTESSGYRAEIGIGEKLASVLDIHLEYKPGSFTRDESGKAGDTKSASYRWSGGGLATSYGTGKLAGSHDAPINPTVQSRFTTSSSTATGSGIRLTLHYDAAVDTDECRINDHLMTLRFTH